MGKLKVVVGYDESTTVQPQHFRQDDLNNDIIIISQPLSVFIFGVFTVDKGCEF
jgi:hypothetical protein